MHGVTTNRDLLAAILREPEFLAGATDTGYLTRHDPAALAAPDRAATARARLAAALARQAGHRAAAPVLATLPSGWRNVSSIRHTAEYHTGTADLIVAYRVDGPEVRATVNGEAPGEHVAMRGLHARCRRSGDRRHPPPLSRRPGARRPRLRRRSRYARSH